MLSQNNEGDVFFFFFLNSSVIEYKSWGLFDDWLTVLFFSLSFFFSCWSSSYINSKLAVAISGKSRMFFFEKCVFNVARLCPSFTVRMESGLNPHQRCLCTVLTFLLYSRRKHPKISWISAVMYCFHPFCLHGGLFTVLADCLLAL